MFEKVTDPGEVVLVEGEIPVRHRYTAGIAGERFFRSLKDEGWILGTHCAACAITYVPGRAFCERCFGALDDWRRVGPEGVVEAVSVAHRGPDGQALEQPQAYGLILLDGADTPLLHRLGPGIEWTAGTRVHPVLRDREERQGSINDIAHFTAAT